MSDGDVLDVGCGPGAYLARLGAGGRRVGIDLSDGMATIARTNAPEAKLVVGDAQALPFPGGSFDVVLAPHMLYHVPDMGHAAAELARVLRHGGVALVVTNGERHMREMFGLMRRAVLHVAPDATLEGWHRFAERFCVETGARVLEPALRVERVTERRGDLAVPEVDPVLEYVRSTRSLTEPQLPTGVTWDDMLDAVERMAGEEIASTGAWRAGTHVGAFVCRKPPA